MSSKKCSFDETLKRRAKKAMEAYSSFLYFLSKLSEAFAYFQGITKDVCKFMSSKNGGIEQLDGTVRIVTQALVFELTKLSAKHQSVRLKIDDILKASERFSRELRHDKNGIVRDATARRKDYDSSVDRLKSKRSDYHRKARQAVEDHERAGRSPADSARAAKSDTAASRADQEYADAVERTNEHQRRYYTEEQPEMLENFAQWQDARFGFIQDQLKVLAEAFSSAKISEDWESLESNFYECCESLDVEADMVQYRQMLQSDLSTPEDYKYERAPVGPSSGGGVRTAESSAKKGDKGGKDKGGKDKGGKDKGGKDKGGSCSVAIGGGGGGGSKSKGSGAKDKGGRKAPPPPPDDEEEEEEEEESGTWCRVLYDFKARDGTELTVKKGQQVYVTKRDDDWCTAQTEDGTEGYVPSAYVS